MSESFHHVLFPGSARVLGVSLPPLSLWTLSALGAIQSPFLSADSAAEVTLSDLQIAVRVVCAPVLTVPDLRPRFLNRWQFFRRRNDRAFLEHHAGVFLAWLATHQRLPALWQQETDHEPRLLSAPLALSLVTGLMQLGMTHTDAWSCGPGYARWLLLASQERESDAVRFVQDDEDDLDAELEAFDQRSEAEINAQAKLDLDPETFDRWIQQRAANCEPRTEP